MKSLAMIGYEVKKNLSRSQNLITTTTTPTKRTTEQEQRWWRLETRFLV